MGLDNGTNYDIVLNANDLHLHLESLRKSPGGMVTNLGKEIFMHELLHIIEHTLIEAVKLVPFLFLTYLAMEYLEHKTGDKAKSMVKKAGKWGPFIGGLAGAVPQCGFSAAASNLYAGRVITLGTLIAIFLSTSDEMLPILISAQMPMRTIAGVLLVKILIGAAAGFVIDRVMHKKEEHHHHHHDHDQEQSHIHELCEHEHCNCEKGIVRSAIKHTLQITFFIIIITFLLHLVMEFVGEDALAKLILNQPLLGPVLAGLVGLIPNCASSVVLTQLYVENAMSLGAMMAGLLVGSGVGLLVLFRVNHDRNENLKILGLLYLIGVVVGIVIELILRMGL